MFIMGCRYCIDWSVDDLWIKRIYLIMHYVYSLEYHGRLHIQLHMYIKNKIRRKLWIQFLQN
jgi:hypothetical protein